MYRIRASIDQQKMIQILVPYAIRTVDFRLKTFKSDFMEKNEKLRLDWILTAVRLDLNKNIQVESFAMLKSRSNNSNKKTAALAKTCIATQLQKIIIYSYSH